MNKSMPLSDWVESTVPTYGGDMNETMLEWCEGLIVIPDRRVEQLGHFQSGWTGFEKRKAPYKYRDEKK